MQHSQRLLRRLGLGGLLGLALVLGFLAGLAPGASGAAGAWSLGGYGLAWWTVDTGGATFSAGGPYTLGGSIGQHDAATASGAGYSVAGGFWVSSVLATPTATPSATPPVTATPTASASATATTGASPTASASATATTGASPTASASATATTGASPTASASATATAPAPAHRLYLPAVFRNAIDP